MVTTDFFARSDNATTSGDSGAGAAAAEMVVTSQRTTNGTRPIVNERWLTTDYTDGTDGKRIANSITAYCAHAETRQQYDTERALNPSNPIGRLYLPSWYLAPVLNRLQAALNVLAG